MRSTRSVTSGCSMTSSMPARLEPADQLAEVALVGAEAGAGVEGVAEQDVVLRVEHVVDGELGGVEAVGLGEQRS